MSRVPNQIIEEIRSRCDIVEVVGSYLPLKQRGAAYYALCPFHTEKTPSFAVNQAKQIFHCFGCGVGGDVFSFVAKHQNLSFYEALKVLADRCGVRLPSRQQTNRELSRLAERERLYGINESAAKYYQRLLHEPAGTPAREYLARRGVSKDWMEKFALGYAPPGWDQLLKYMVNKGFTPQQLLQAGLVVPRSKGGGYYDRFRQRLMFPIYNAQGKVIGFGGRALDEEQQPKYLNSPDTPVYHKGQGFYGLNWAQNEIGKRAQAIILEGYFDLITACQHGFTNVVAALGTAITEAQVSRLRRLAEEVIILFDADSAGIKAAMRSWPLFLASGLRVKVALGTDGDPDSYIRTYGAEAFAKCIEQAVPLVDFVIDYHVAESNPDTVESKIECLNKILPVLANIHNRIERTSYLSKLAEKLRVEEGILLSELKKVVEVGKRRLDKPASMTGSPLTSATQVAERMLTQLMIYRPAIRQLALAQLTHEDFATSVYGNVFKALQAVEGDVEGEGVASLMGQLEDEAAKEFVSSVAFAQETFEDAERVAADCINVLKRKRLKARLKELKLAKDKQALQEYERLVKRMKLGNLPAGA
jgi:DNA primase